MRFLPYILVFLLISSFSTPVFSQSVTGHSPISRFGLGSSWGYGLSRNEGMGACGLASPSQDHVNFINPALLPYTEKVNLEIDLRYINRSVKVGDSYSYQNGGGGPAQVSISIPISKRLTTAVGVRPFTNRDFLYSQIRYLGGDSIQYYSRGSGGTAQVFLSGGYRLNKYISLGLETGFVFGTLQDSLKFGSMPVSGNFTFISLNKRRVSQLTFKPGINFRYPINAENHTYLSFGATADLTRKFAYQNYQTFLVKGGGTAADVVDDGSKGTIDRPGAWSFGLGLFKSLSWSLNAEYDYWNTSGISSSDPDFAFRSGYGFRLGGEYSPGTKRSTTYFNIITFRGGLGFSELPYLVDGKSMTDKSLSVGASFPIIRKEAKYSRPLLNIALMYGQTGNRTTTAGIENYWKVTFGITLNDLLWFNRYRVD